MAQAAGIFVSHAHEDNAWCREFVQALRDAGADVWYDEYSLGHGRITEEIERELRARPIFVLILSPVSVGKRWVQREMDAAMRLQDRDPTRIILPVMSDKAEIPLFWEEYKRVGGPDDSGIPATEAAEQVVHTLAIVPAGAPAAVLPPAAADTADAAWERGKGLYAQKRTTESLAAFERAIALEPGKASYWNSKGNALWSLKRYEEALAALEQALALDPEFALAWNNKGNALWRLKRPNDALAAYERALALDAQFAIAWSNKGEVLWHLQREAEALVAYERALALDSQRAGAWDDAGAELIAVERVLARHPQSAGAWNKKIALLRKLGHMTEAEEAERQRGAALWSQS